MNEVHVSLPDPLLVWVNVAIIRLTEGEFQVLLLRDGNSSKCFWHLPCDYARKNEALRGTAERIAGGWLGNCNIALLEQICLIDGDAACNVLYLSLPKGESAQRLCSKDAQWFSVFCLPPLMKPQMIKIALLHFYCELDESISAVAYLKQRQALLKSFS